MTRKLHSEEFVEINGEVRRQTDKAILFFDGKREVWLPKSQIEDPEDFEIGKNIDILLPAWLATENGLT